MIEKEFANHFATEWIEAWNSHDLTRILSHYADDFEMSTPFIARVVGEPSGRLTGKDKISAYFEKGLQLAPDLHFELLTILAGVGSVTLHYKAVDDRIAAEVFHFNSEGKVEKVFAHYAV